jgi:hypothetical protein
LSNVRARLEAQQAYVEDCDNEILRDFLIYEMIDSPLQDQYGMVDEAHGEDVIFNPIRESREQDSEDETDGEEIEESD